jgi:hypothetical protein
MYQGTNKVERILMVEFKAWPKIPRGGKDLVTVTEKMDGTNACIIIEEGKILGVQSRKRLITPEQDNYDFAGWVSRNEGELVKLGDGYHYGEWAGLGIQKNPHNLEEKTFFLFNTYRWMQDPSLPNICAVVPVLYHGTYYENMVEDIMLTLKDDAEAIYEPEGIVVFSHTTQCMTKYTFKFSEGKWKGN